MKTHKTVTTEFSPSSLYRELYTHRTSAHAFEEEIINKGGKRNCAASGKRSAVSEMDSDV